MTLEELKKRCETAKIKYQYGYVDDGVQPPFLVGVVSDSNNFIADDVVYKKINNIQLFYIYKSKDLSMESTIEDSILYDVAWRKSDEEYFVDEGVWQVIYYFSI